MSDVVFLLGAGASRESGCPLMFDFLDRAVELEHLGQLDDLKRQLSMVGRVRSTLQQAFVKSRFDVDNLESVFSAIEMGRILGRLGEMTDADVAHSREAIVRVIVRTLEQTQQFEVRRHEYVNHVRPHRSYLELASLIYDLMHCRKPKSVAVITFNYDIGIDFALAARGLHPNYHLGNGTPKKRQETVDLLKLHGSLNWVQSAESDPRHITPYEMNDLISTLAYEGEHSSITLPVFSHFATEAHLGSCHPIPFIVPPTDAKIVFREQIAPVWQRAADHLAEATTVIVIGYSIPPTDQFFRDFYAISTIGPKLLDRFWVVDKGPEAEKKYTSVIGGGALRRFRYFSDGLGESLPVMRMELGTLLK